MTVDSTHMFGFSIIKTKNLQEQKEINKNLLIEINHLREEINQLVSDNELQQDTIGKLQTHLRKAKESSVADQFTSEDIPISKEIKQIVYAIFHQYAERSMESSIIKKEEKKFQSVYKDYMKHLQKL